jgi:hypothetical protein
MSNSYEDIRRLGLNIDTEAFNDVVVMLKEKSDYEAHILGVRELWRIWCSPPPCKLREGSLQEIFEAIERSFEIQT